MTKSRGWPRCCRGPSPDERGPERDRVMRAAFDVNEQHAWDLLYLAGCLAKMQRTGDCSRDFSRGCAEPVTDEHVSYAVEILHGLGLYPTEDGQTVYSKP